MLGARRVQLLDELWPVLDTAGPLVLDGIPNTAEELELIESKAPEGRGIDHTLYLEASADVRLARIKRMVVAGADPASARERLLRPADLRALRKRLETTGRLTVIEATRSRSEILGDALGALGIPV